MEIQIVNLPKIQDPRGNLTFIEAQKHVPFEIKRVYWIYDVPGGETRGGHAFKQQDEFIVAISGSFDVAINAGRGEHVYSLNRSFNGLMVPSGHWRRMENFSTNSLALVLSSTFYDPDDYVRDFNEFMHCFEFQDINVLPQVSFNNNSLHVDFRKTTINECVFYELDKHHREKGNITVVENRQLIPFDIKRVYYLYDVPGGEDRGGHAHKDLFQLIIAAGGSFDVVLNDGRNKKIVSLNRPYQGLLVVPGIWREIVNFSSGSTCLVLASEFYSEADYIREYVDFKLSKL
jgi:dTDP-4-dehydrorhamnose 3,5-epimerase-like enzyme